jgi:U3 small nucleolar RNA-associated protein 23
MKVLIQVMILLKIRVDLLVITHCTTHELRERGEEYGLANVMAKKFQRARCPHDRSNPVPSAVCIKEVFGME